MWLLHGTEVLHSLEDKLWGPSIMTKVLTSSLVQYAVLWVVYQRVVEVGYELALISLSFC